MFNFDMTRAVVANSWADLRRCDVFRLVDITPDEHRDAMVERIIAEHSYYVNDARRALLDIREEFALANDPPAHVPAKFANAERTAQRVLVEGMDCLPGQLDLF